MNTTETLPKSPGEMPWDWDSGNQVRNCVVTLRKYRSVSIHWQRDDEASNVTGESCGEWEVSILGNRREYTAKHENIINALWFAVTLADAANTEVYEERERARKEALAKLTLADRQALGLR